MNLEELAKRIVSEIPNDAGPDYVRMIGAAAAACQELDYIKSCGIDMKKSSELCRATDAALDAIDTPKPVAKSWTFDELREKPYFRFDPMKIMTQASGFDPAGCIWCWRGKEYDDLTQSKCMDAMKKSAAIHWPGRTIKSYQQFYMEKLSWLLVVWVDQSATDLPQN